MKINKSDLEKLIQETFESLYEDSDDKNFFVSNDNNNNNALWPIVYHGTYPILLKNIYEQINLVLWTRTICRISSNVVE